MNSIKVLSGQSLFDIAIQECGSVEAVIQLAMLNNISITDSLTPGQILLTSEVVNRENVQYLKNRKLNPATSPFPTTKSPGIFDDTFDETFN